MRLYKEKIRQAGFEKIAYFKKWMLKIGDGTLYDDAEQGLIRIHPDICLNTNKNPMKVIIEVIYPVLLENDNDPTYLRERTILTPKNEMAQELNDMIMNMMPGDERTSFSSDTMYKLTDKIVDNDILYLAEYLHSLTFNDVPNHDLKLKEGAHVMLLRNINQPEGLCSGTILIVTCLGKWSIRADKISSNKVG